MPLLSGLSTGVKHGTRLRARAISIVRGAAKIEPLSESHCTGCGAQIRPKRCSTQRTIMSRIISPEIPAVVATQLITLRSWQSRAKATRTTSPFQQVNSSASEHQRQFERIVATWPPCSRARPADRRRELDIAGALLWPAPRPSPVTPFEDVRARDAERLADPLHGVS